MKLAIALFQPDIPGNTGAVLRLGACLNIPVHIIAPTGFELSSSSLKRAGMDYISRSQLIQHEDWQNFLHFSHKENKRLLLFSTSATQNYYNFSYQDDDILLFGRESCGAPSYVHAAAHQQLYIPMVKGARSLNLAMSVAMSVAIALAPV